MLRMSLESMLSVLPQSRPYRPPLYGLQHQPRFIQVSPRSKKEENNAQAYSDQVTRQLLFIETHWGQLLNRLSIEYPSPLDTLEWYLVFEVPY